MSKNKSNKVIQLYDQVLDTKSEGIVWSGQGRNDVISLDDLVIKLRHECRDEFIAWSSKLAFGVPQMAERLRVDSDFSQWWMSSIAERDSTRVEFFNYFKLLSLDIWARQNGFTQIIYEGSNENLKRVFGTSTPFPVFRNFRQGLIFFKGLIWPLFFWIKSGRGIKRLQKTTPVLNTEAPCLLSFFPNFDQQELKKGLHKSNYWMDVQDSLESLFGGLIHLWVPMDQKGTSHLFDSIGKLRRNETSKEKYICLEEFLRFSDCLSVSFLILKRFFRVRNAMRILQKCASASTGFSFWPVLEEGFWESLTGPWAAQNLLTWKASTKFSEVSGISKLFILHENQPWQMALLSAWNRANRGPVYGYVHVALRDMDMRVLTPRSEWSSKSLFARPVPGKILVPGRMAKNILMSVCGFDESKVVEVEAVRHLVKKSESIKKDIGRRLLVLTTLYKLENDRALSWLNTLWEQNDLNQFAQIVLRPHPFCDITDSLQKLNVDLEYEWGREGRVADWIHQNTVVLSTNSSSAVIEAACSKAPIVLMGPKGALDYSALGAKFGAVLVNDIVELKKAIHSPKVVEIKEWLHLDPDLPRWKKFLKELIVVA